MVRPFKVGDFSKFLSFLFPDMHIHLVKGNLNPLCVKGKLQDREAEAAENLIAELQEDLMPVEQLIAFAESEAGAGVSLAFFKSAV